MTVTQWNDILHKNEMAWWYSLIHFLLYRFVEEILLQNLSSTKHKEKKEDNLIVWPN